jgi:hypothetical protein
MDDLFSAICCSGRKSRCFGTFVLVGKQINRVGCTSKSVGIISQCGLEEKEDRDRPEEQWFYTASDDGNLKILVISHQRQLIVTRSKHLKDMKMKVS